MEQKTDILYPSAQFENKNIDLEQRLEERKVVYSLSNHINKIKEMMTYFKDNKNTSKKKNKKTKR